MRITAFGAAETVTGSCHLVEHSGYRLLLDCGAYQGKEEERNDDAFGFEPRQIDAVVLSHAHIDHIGRLPLLIKRGYRGQVWATQATIKLMPVLLQDALHLMTEEHQRALRKGLEVPPLLWDESDLESLMARLQPLELYQSRQMGPFKLRFEQAGHLPGSAFVVIQTQQQTLVFSGDLGHRRKEVLPQPDYPPQADWVICEATYGDRPHRPVSSTLEEFAEILTQTLSDGGKVFIPSFALERTQELLFYIRELEQERRIPIVPVFVDSPMASKITKIYPDLKEYFSFQVQSLFERGQDPFKPTVLRFTQSIEESKAINELQSPAIIIAGNGMISGGRILHHLRHGLPIANNALIIVGYQPRGGIGELLIRGEDRIKVLGQEVSVRAKTHTLGGFSGHAGQDELLDWLAGDSKVALVHAEPDRMQMLAQKLTERGQSAVSLRWGQPLDLA